MKKKDVVKLYDEQGNVVAKTSSIKQSMINSIIEGLGTDKIFFDHNGTLVPIQGMNKENDMHNDDVDDDAILEDHEVEEEEKGEDTIASKEETYTQEQLKDMIVPGVSCIAQYRVKHSMFSGKSLHYQIACQCLNRDYGYAETKWQAYPKLYELAMNIPDDSRVESLFKEGATTKFYRQFIIHKSTLENHVIFQVGNHYELMKDKIVYNNIEFIMMFQEKANQK